MRYIYIILTATPSKFGKLVRFMTNATHNHISISLNEDLAPVYAFARRYNKIPLDGGLVREYLDRFTLERDIQVNANIYKIPVDKQTYEQVKREIAKMEKDEEYIYNLYAALSYPFVGGFHTYKTFTCVEFGAYVLKRAGFLLEKDPCHYTPQELGNELLPYLYYSGDLCEYKDFKNGEIYNENFFKRQPYNVVFRKSFRTFHLLNKRNLKNFCKSYPNA